MNRNVDRKAGIVFFFALSVAASFGCDDAGSPASAEEPNETTTGIPAPAGPPSSPPAVVTPAPPAPAPAPAPACALGTRSFFAVNGKVVESITSEGRLFNFESNGAAWQTNGVDLTDVAGYATGPCRGRARGQCTFDTRTFVPVGNVVTESITAYGSYWSFNASGQATSTDLALMPRYRNGGPCDGRAPGQCKFDTRTFMLQGSDVIEAVTAYGRGYNYKLDGTPVPGSGTDLTTIARYAVGPCAGASAGQCVFQTRVYEDVNGHVLETITANGKLFRYEASGAAALSEVQPSNVMIAGMEPWASGVCKK